MQEVYMRQTSCMCTRARCSSSSFSLCVMRLQLAFDLDLQLAHGCAPISKNGFFRNYLLERLIPHLHVCEVPSRTLLIHRRDVHTFVEAQVFISRNFVFQMQVVRFRFDVLPLAIEHFYHQKTLPPLVVVTLHFHLHPSARFPPNLLSEHRPLVTWTVDFRCPWLALCLRWRMKHHLWR